MLDTYTLNLQPEPAENKIPKGRSLNAEAHDAVVVRLGAGAACS